MICIHKVSAEVTSESVAGVQLSWCQAEAEGSANKPAPCLQFGHGTTPTGRSTDCPSRRNSSAI